MASIPQKIHIRAKFDGRVFVPEEPVELATGTVLDGWIVPNLDAWPAGYIASTMGAWGDDDVEEPLDLPLIAEETLSDEVA